MTGTEERIDMAFAGYTLNDMRRTLDGLPGDRPGNQFVIVDGWDVWGSWDWSQIPESAYRVDGGHQDPEYYLRSGV